MQPFMRRPKRMLLGVALAALCLAIQPIVRRSDMSLGTFTVFHVGVVVLAVCFLVTHAAQAQSASTLDFKGRLLISVSDADMVASAYSDGDLGPVDGQDALSVIPLGKPPRDWRAFEIGVSTSVVGPPAVVAVTPDGRYAIVSESLRPRPTDGGRLTFRDLKPGNTLTVVELSTPESPTVVQRVEGPAQPDAVSINADGSLVAVPVNPSGAGKTTPWVIYPFVNGRLGTPITPTVPGWVSGDRLIHAAFHPREDLLAIVNATKAALSFMRVERSGNDLRLTTWGNTVAIERGPFVARFTPDGRHVITSATYGGGEFGSLRGTVMSVRVDGRRDASGSPRHEVVSRAQTGVLPEGMAISPDGAFVVTTNLERSMATPDDPRQTFYSSLTLLKLDVQTGILTRVGDSAFDGILPEAAAFDASSRFLAVTNFGHFDEARKGASIDIWRIATDRFDPSRIELVRTGYLVPVTRGAHSLVLVP